MSATRGLITQTVSSNPPSTLIPFCDNIDATHPAYVDFVLPSAMKVNFVKLSMKFRLYRTYNSYSASSTGAESGHSHNHSHTLSLLGGSSGNTISITVGQLSAFSGAINDTATVQSNAAGSSGHTHGITGSSTLGVSEGGLTTIVAIAIDGTDVTASLGGGPWASDIVDLDLTSLMPIGDGRWHTVTLTPSGQGRLVATLRLA